MESKKTLVVGASTKPERYAYKAIVKLLDYQHEVIAYGNREGVVNGVEIETIWNPDWKVDTVTLYVGPANQTVLMDDVVALKPNRVIFNPGTENVVFYDKLDMAGIPYEEACTLVLLSTDAY
jgi:uncharacterized protein